jgi:transposase
VSAGDPFVSYPNEGTVQMIVIGADTHKHSHTVSAVDAVTGRVLADRTVKAKRRSFDDLLVWARRLGAERVWALEDCRHVSGALERFLLRCSERVVRVAPKLMAGARRSAREPGKSDAIDAVAIARAALREGLETLPVAQLAGPELDVRLLVDHRKRLVAQRTALVNDLRWHLHDRWPDLEIPTRALITTRWQDRVAGRLAHAEQTARVRIARDELRRIRALSRSIDALQRELAVLVADLAPRLLAEQGCGVLTAAKLIGEIAGIGRFVSDAKLVRIAGSAPIPAFSGNTDRHRLDRGGNRQLNCALHRLAVTKGRLDPDTAAYLAANKPTARAAAKPCAASNATSPAASSDSCNPRPPSSPHAHQRTRLPSRPPAPRSTATRPTAASH